MLNQDETLCMEQIQIVWLKTKVKWQNCEMYWTSFIIFNLVDFEEKLSHRNLDWSDQTGTLSANEETFSYRRGARGKWIHLLLGAQKNEYSVISGDGKKVRPGSVLNGNFDVYMYTCPKYARKSTKLKFGWNVA